MKTVLILAGLVALTLGVAVPHHDWKFETVDADFIARQKKVLSLFENVGENDKWSECYKYGNNYNVETNIDNYTNKKAVEEFLTFYRTGFMPKYHEFSVFYERMRDEAIALFHIMYYAKDFDTFYKTAAWAKLNFNEGQFLYAYYIAVLQRADTHGIVLPAPYEVYPQYFFNKEVLYKMFNKFLHSTDMSPEFGVVKEHDHYVFYANYSSSLTYPNEEQRISYLTEDMGWNAFYYYFHTHLPFWWTSLNKYPEYKERRGEIYFYFYQQLLARYNLERMSNGLGETGEFSWYLPFKTGYYPSLTTGFLPFAQRSNYFDIHSTQNLEAVRFLDAYEKTFFQYLQQGHFKAFDRNVDFHDPKAINFVGNYWQTNADLYSEEHIEDYQHSYEITARHVLSASPEPIDKYTFIPSALHSYQTSLRDPAFYQLYQRIVDYFIHFKEYLKPYTYEQLNFSGVKINDVKVNKLVTYFDYYNFNLTNSLLNKEELKDYPDSFVIRQPRLAHKPFTVTVDIKSEVACDAAFKVFIGPKYDSNGYPINIEQDWMKFYELDWFVHKLSQGENKVERKSSEFLFFKEDSVSTTEIWKWLEESKVPYHMAYTPSYMPRRLMLPKGTHGGYPFQMFVFVYPYKGDVKEMNVLKQFDMDKKPLGYPFDRPVKDAYFKLPNMFFEDVEIYHEGKVFSYELNTPAYFTQKKV